MTAEWIIIIVLYLIILAPCVFKWMKGATFLGRVIVIALLVCAFAAAIVYMAILKINEREYVEIGETNRMKYYLLVNSLEKQNIDGIECVVGTLKLIYKKPQKWAPTIDGKKASYTLELCAANPKAKQMIHFSSAVYDKDHNLLETVQFPSDTDTWIDCIPNTAREGCREAIIKTYNKSRKR